MTHFDILAAEPEAAELSHLLDTCFGPGRLARTAERLREGNQAISAHSHCIRQDGRLLAAISFWPIRIGDTPALLLGPLAVHPDLQGQGAGQGLMQTALAGIDAARFPVVMLVGDLPYYEKAGFAVAPDAVRMPGPVDAARLLVRGDAAQCAGLSGAVRPAPDLC